MTDWWQELFDERYFRFYDRLAEPVTADEDAAFVARALALAPGARVLDLGCGQGRHAVALALLGYTVTGLDLSRFLLDQARALAGARGVEVAWVERDMRHTADLGPFDACVSLHTAFGYFTDAENRRVLEEARAALRPGGRLLLDLDNPYPLLRRMPFDTWRERPQHVTHEHMELDPLRSHRVTTRTRYPIGGDREEVPASSVRLFYPHEVRSLLGECGFEVEGLYGSLRDDPYDWPRSPRLLFTATRSDPEEAR